jgi:hypothetical protein
MANTNDQIDVLGTNWHTSRHIGAVVQQKPLT